MIATDLFLVTTGGPVEAAPKRMILIGRVALAVGVLLSASLLAPPAITSAQAACPAHQPNCR